MISLLVTILLAVLIIGTAVFIHELGHFVSAKIVDMKVEGFYMGMGPTIFSKKIGETVYGIKLFPIGGSVRILGEEESVADKRSFSEKDPWAKLFVAFSGIIMNVILASVVYYVLLGFNSFAYDKIPYNEDFKLWFGEQSEDVMSGVYIVGVIEGTGADDADLETPIQVVSLEGIEVEMVDDFTDAIENNAGEIVTLEYIGVEGEGSEEIQISEGGKMGVEISGGARVIKVEYKGFNMVFSGFLHSLNMVEVNGYILGQLISESFEEKDISPVADTLTGPIGLVSLVDQFREFGFWAMLDLFALLNLSLAMMNILPFPALDGGHGVIIGIEAIIGRQINEKVKAVMFLIGMGLIFLLAFLISIQDLGRLGVWDFFRNFFDSIF